MTKSVLIGLTFIGMVWLAYMCWLTGYQSGYEDGEARAWERLDNPFFAQMTRDAETDSIQVISHEPDKYVQWEVNQ